MFERIEKNLKRKSEHTEFKNISQVVNPSLVLKGWMSIRHCTSLQTYLDET